MTVKSILDAKGRDVVTVGPVAEIRHAVGMLSEHRIGALVVVGDRGEVLGILSERDVVSALAHHGEAALARPVSDYMTRDVHECEAQDTVNHIMELMTRHRFRHLPVTADGRLGGIISIGDVVKRRIEDVQREADEIRQYIATA